MIATATDEALARRAAEGQREAFEELVRRHRSRVFALALRICRNADDAEDALQETFIAAYRALPRFDGRARVSTWLYRIATNKCYDIVARRRPSADFAALPEAADSRDPFAGSRQAEQLTRALDGLPEQFREAALLCDVCGLTPAEAGEVAGVPEGTMKSRSFRARALLAVALRADGAEPADGRRGLTHVDDTGFEAEVPADELEAVRRSLAAFGQGPLPSAVATRLDARLAAELDSSPLSRRRTRRGRVRLGAALSAAAAVAAIAVFALSWGGGSTRPPGAPEGAPQGSVAATPAADSSAKVASAATKAPPAGKPCPPATRTGGGRPRAACPGARGGHARAV